MADTTVTTIKTIQLKGDAAEAYKSLKNGTRKRRGRKPRVQEGGFDDIPGPRIDMRQIDTNHATQLSRAANITKVGGAVTAPKDQKDQKGGAVQPPANIVTTAGHAIVNKPVETPAIKAAVEAGTLPTPNPVLPSGQQQGGKLVLAPKKKKTGAILLAPPSHRKLTGTRSTRSSKKIRVQLSNMKKRITTAKVIHKESKEKSIDEIRRLLEEAKLVKPASSGKKVPDDILRNIYRDYLILRNKAL